MTYKCIIVDDEPYFTELMEEYIKEIPALELVKIFHDPLKALAEVVNEDQIDIVFLDIHMPRLTGIELAPILKKKCRFLVFITAYSQHAAKAFDLEADDFLCKPFTSERLQQTITKIIGKNTDLNLPVKTPGDFYLKISGTKSNYMKFFYNEIVAFESDKNYIKIHTLYGCHSYYMGIKEIEEKLSVQTEFIRIHRSFIISKAFIAQVDNNIVILKHNGLKIPVGNIYRKAFFEYLERNRF